MTTQDLFSRLREKVPEGRMRADFKKLAKKPVSSGGRGIFFHLFHSLLGFILCATATWAASQEYINCSQIVTLKPYQLPSYADEKWDGYCSRFFLQKYAPHGFIAVFGANRQVAAYQDDYTVIYEFAKKWSADKASLRLPIATGGGGGMMRAATLGAKEGRPDAKVLSLDVNIYDSSSTVEKIGPQDIKRYTFIYRNITKREADLIDHAQGVVISLGGIGTVWEFMETLDKIHLRKKAPVPIIILSKSANEYTRMIERLINQDMEARQICQYVNVTNSPDKAIALIKATPAVRQSDPSNMCFSLGSVHSAQRNGHL